MQRFVGLSQLSLLLQYTTWDGQKAADVGPQKKQGIGHLCSWVPKLLQVGKAHLSFSPCVDQGSSKKQNQ